jgi:hypothetical protein
MKVTQTIELNDKERLAIARALKIIDEISDIVDAPMVDVFDYFAVNSDLTAVGQYSVKNLHSIKEIRGEE